MSDSNQCKICRSADTELVCTGLYDTRHGYQGIFGIRRCRVCGFCRTEPSPKREDLPDLYRQYYPRNSLTLAQVQSNYAVSQNQSRFASWLEGGLTTIYKRIPHDSRILDVGCGDCVSLLLARTNGAMKAVGVEVDENVRDIARSLNLDVHIGQLSDLPQDRGQFDYIFAMQVFEHEPEPSQLLQEMKDRLAAKGRIVLCFPNVDCPYRYIFKNKWIHWHVPYHLNHFSRKSIEELAKNCHMEVQSIETVTPNAWTHWQLRALDVKVEYGQRDTFWDPGVPDNLRQESKYTSLLPRRVASIFCSFTQRIIRDPFICLSNRFLDSFGLGESFLVTLSK